MSTSRFLFTSWSQLGSPTLKRGMATSKSRPCPYEILNIPKTASLKEIKAAYYQMAWKYHPDRVKSDKSREFVEITRAYEILGNPTLKQRYDQYGSTHQTSYRSPSPPMNQGPIYMSNGALSLGILGLALVGNLFYATWIQKSWKARQELLDEQDRQCQAEWNRALFFRKEKRANLERRAAAEASLTAGTSHALEGTASTRHIQVQPIHWVKKKKAPSTEYSEDALQGLEHLII